MTSDCNVEAHHSLTTSGMSTFGFHQALRNYVGEESFESVLGSADRFSSELRRGLSATRTRAQMACVGDSVTVHRPRSLAS